MSNELAKENDKLLEKIIQQLSDIDTRLAMINATLREAGKHD